MSMGHQIRPVKVNEKDIPWSPLSDSSSGSCGSSSSFSWTDETDQSTSRDLEEQFQKFEEALYLESNPNDLPQSLQDEFKIWAEYSPHIRIRGIRAKLNKRNENEGGEEVYDVDYEEVLAIHDSQESPNKKSSSASEINKNDVSPSTQADSVNKLFDENWPIMQERIEPIVKPVSACESKTDVKMLKRFKTNSKTINSQKILTRSNSSRSYLRDSSPRKVNIDYGSEYSCPFSSRGVKLHTDNYSRRQLSGRESNRAPRTSVQKSRINRISTFSAKIPDNSHLNRSKGIQLTCNKKSKTQGSDRTVILPPIEALAIKPKKLDKRVNSAMVRFTKTLPRVRPNTSKKKIVSGTSFNLEHKETKPIDNEVDESVHFTTLEIIGTKTNTANRGSRWRY